MSHICHWPTCKVPVSPKMWGCRSHWFTLPKAIRDRIWDTYVPGQEIRKDPSKEYLAAALEADKWVRAQIQAGKAS
jgi:hypothetical protein